MVLSHARIMFRKLRGIGRRDNEPAPSAPPATTAESEPVNPSPSPSPSPRAIHISEVRRSPTEHPRKRGYDIQSVSIFVANAKGAVGAADLYRLLQREKGCEVYDPTGYCDTDYLCDGYFYNVCFLSPPSDPEPLSAWLTLMQHVCLVFTYDASSRESWDETVAACERMRSRCKDGVLPFLATVIAAIGGGDGDGDGGPSGVPHAEAEAFATQRGCRFVRFSPATGRGICDAVGSLVELANGARDQYTLDQEGEEQRYRRATHAFQAVFAS